MDHGVRRPWSDWASVAIDLGLTFLTHVDHAAEAASLSRRSTVNSTD